VRRRPPPPLPPAFARRPGAPCARRPGAPCAQRRDAFRGSSRENFDAGGCGAGGCGAGGCGAGGCSATSCGGANGACGGASGAGGDIGVCGGPSCSGGGCDSASGRCPATHWPRTPARLAHRVPGREPFVSTGDRNSVFNVAFDERPLHYSPHAGLEWAHLAPPADRGPVAFPILSTDAAQMFARDMFSAAPGAAAATACGGAQVLSGVELSLQILKVVLLFVIVAMLAFAMVAAGREARALTSVIRDAIASLRPGAP
jgi:hypothetical protein